MKICIIGAGAIGGLLAARLHHAGENVSIVARGPHLEAIRANGLALMENDGTTITAHVRVSDTIADAGPQDLIVLAVKAHQLGAVVADLPAICHAETIVLTAQNGMPWWYFQKHGGPMEGHRLESVDPGGLIAAHLPVARIIACVVYPAAEIMAPGIIRHIENNRFSLAEIDNSATPRIKAVSDIFTRAGFKAPVVSDIRAEIWTKLWGNLSFNPVSALTHATLEGICADPLGRALVASMMAEAQAIGEALGIRFRIAIDKRIANAAAVGAHKTSMLQDIEAGRAIEADALLGSVIELGRLVEIATPHLDAVFALVKLLAKTLGSQHASLKPSPLAS